MNQKYLDIRGKLPLLVCTVFGIVLMSVWADLVGHGFALASSADMVSPISNARVFFLCGLTFAALACMVFPKRHKRFDRSITFVVCVVSVVATIIFCFPQPGLFASGEISVALSLFLIGLGYGWLSVHLLCLFAQEAVFSYVVYAIVSSLLIKTLFSSAISSFMNSFVQIIFAIASPAIAAFLLVFAQYALDRRDESLDLAELPRYHNSDKRVLLGLIIMIAPLRAMVRILSNMGFWGSGYVTQNLFTGIDFVILVVALFLLAQLTLVKEEGSDMMLRFLPALLVLLGGFIILDPDMVAILRLSDTWDHLLVILVELFSHLLYWTVIVLAVRGLDIHPYRVVGIVYVLFGTTSIASALLLQNVDEINRTLIFFTMYFFIIAFMFLLRNNRFNKEKVFGAEISAALAKHDPIEVLAQRHQLSPRETEVFILLAQGRSRAFIKGELFLAEGTVKTHTTRIYHKLGVKNRQELISKIQETEEISVQ